MQIEINQELVEKTFVKVGQMSQEDLDLSGNNGVAFMQGFVDSLHKEAGMNPQQILGFIKYATEVGFKTNFNKVACDENVGQELDELFERAEEKLASWDWVNPANWPVIKQVTEAGGRNAARGAMKEVGDTLGRGIEYLKSPEFLGKAAPWAIGALGGYLIPKMLGGQGNGLLNAAAGAAAVGGGKMLADKYDLMNPETWKVFVDKSKNFISGGK
jgi:hypothetical protein